MTKKTEVFRILEIEPTNDKRAIKKAYARMVKKYHPEEAPEKWKEVHDAYEAALAMAEHGIVEPHTEGMEQLKPGGPQEPDEPKEPNRPREPDEPKEPNRPQEPDEPNKLHGLDEQQAPDSPESGRSYTAEELEEITHLFDRVNAIASRQQEEENAFQEERARQVINIVTDLLKKEMFTRKTWSILFEQENLLPVFSSSEFLYAFGDCFPGKRLTAELHHYLREQLARIQDYDDERRLAMGAISGENSTSVRDAVAYAAGKIDAAHYANIERQAEAQKKKTKKSSIMILPQILVGIMAVVMLLCGVILLFA